MTLRAVPPRAITPPGWDTESSDQVIDVEVVEPGRLRNVIEVARFKAYYISLVPARQGDYKLALGIPHAEKDLAWRLSDFDGNMLEIAVSTLKRVE